MRQITRLLTFCIALSLGLGLTPLVSAAPSAACQALNASAVAWVTLDADGNIDQQVDSYPAGVSLITPVFEYACVPRKTTIVTVFTFNGQTVHTDRESLAATSRKGLYGFPLSSGEAPFDEGVWQVEFYADKTLLTSGSVTVGAAQAGAGETASLSVEGEVTDKKSGRPIRGAILLVLTPGVTVQQFLDRGRRDEDVLAGARTDSRGQFIIDAPLARGATYSMLITARGYKATGTDRLQITDSTPNPLVLTITMTK